jgi:hypothetical protein
MQRLSTATDNSRSRLLADALTALDPVQLRLSLRTYRSTPPGRVGILPVRLELTHPRAAETMAAKGTMYRRPLSPVAQPVRRHLQIMGVQPVARGAHEHALVPVWDDRDCHSGRLRGQPDFIECTALVRIVTPYIVPSAWSTTVLLVL